MLTHDSSCIYSFFQRKRKNDNKSNVNVSIEEQINYKLHGAFWIFSPNYFEKFECLDESTFLYGEEDILFLHLRKNNLLTLYIPNK